MCRSVIASVVTYSFILHTIPFAESDEYRPLDYYNGPFNEKVYYEGLRLHNDRLIHNVTIIANTQHLPTIVRETKYPVHHDKGYKISHIQVIDRAICKGQVYIMEGGVGHRNVSLRLEACQFRGMKYNLLIYSLEPVYYVDGVTVLHSYIESMVKKARQQNPDKQYFNKDVP